MKLQWGSFRSKIGRRVVALFVLSAALPMAAMAVLSIAHVNRLLVAHSRAELTRFSANYGMAMYERLLLLEDRLSQLSRAGGAAAPALRSSLDALQTKLDSLAVIAPDGRVIALINAPATAPALGARERAHLAAGQSLLLSRLGEKGPPQVIMLQPFMPDTGEAGLLVAEIRPAYVWGERDTLPAMTDLCVLDETLRPLHCSRPTPAVAFRGLAEQAVRNAGGELDWDEGQQRFVAGYYGVFLRPQFFVHSWTVVASQPESDVLAPVAAFKQSFLAVIALSILLVGMLSITQIRRTLVPLERLIDATRRIAAHDFHSRVEVVRNDEFGELAAAFNKMTRRLDYQFHALTTLSEIDREILSSLDVDRVLEMVLARLHDIAPADFVCVTLVDHASPDAARSFVRDYGRDAAPVVERTELEQADRQALVTARDAFWLERSDADRGYLAPLAIFPADAFFVLPIVWKETLAGVAVLAYRERPLLSDDVVAQVRDLRDRLGVALSTAAREEQLYLEAHYDPLTKLPNRLCFRDQLEQELAHAIRDKASFAVLFVDLDHFKKVNDTAGHATGDALLQEAAARLRRCVRKSDTVARMGGDEFTVILPDMITAQGASNAAGLILKAMSEPFVFRESESFLSASIGIAVYPHDGATGEELVKNADTAMYRAKGSGRNRFVYFEERMNAEAMARVTLERELRRAVERREFELHYQPQLDLRSGAVCGAEALIRWNHPERGLISPIHFIGVAEDVGVIEPLGEWIVRAACEQYQALEARGIPMERLSVNVSSRQFRQKDFVAFVASTLEELGLEPRRLELEITESLLMESGGRSEAALGEFSRLGVRLALDDFGTGYSSLAYLKRFPVDLVKIDRAFVKDVDSDTEARAIVAAIIAMAHALRKEVIAEGVETEAQRDHLHRLGCDHMQGYLFSKPLAAAQFASFLEQRNARAVA